VHTWSAMSTHRIGSVGIIGGTGPMGQGLAARLGHAGLTVLLGSRDPQRAEDAASEIRARITQRAGSVHGGTNPEAAAYGDLSLLTVPYQAGWPILTQLEELLQGRVLVSTAAPMEFRGGLPHPVRPAAGSAAEEVARLCPGTLVVGAFHTVSAPALGRLAASLDEDVLVTSDHPAAKTLVAELIRQIPGLQPVDGGGLVNASFSEGLTPFLIRLNRLHHATTGIRITGLPPSP